MIQNEMVPGNQLEMNFIMLYMNSFMIFLFSTCVPGSDLCFHMCILYFISEEETKDSGG